MRMMIRETGRRGAASGGDGSGGIPVKKLLESVKSTKEARSVILGDLRDKLQGMKFLPDSDSSHDNTPLVDMGIDSLVAVYVRSWFQNELSVDLPVMRILGGASMTDLVESVLEKLPRAMGLLTQVLMPRCKTNLQIKGPLSVPTPRTKQTTKPIDIVMVPSASLMDMWMVCLVGTRTEK